MVTEDTVWFSPSIGSSVPMLVTRMSKIVLKVANFACKQTQSRDRWSDSDFDSET